jgi:hypothetical protein
MENQPLFVAILVVLIFLFNLLIFMLKRKLRRSYYRNVYLKSDAWRR